MPAAPFRVKAVYEYRSEEPDDLNFDNGQVITVTEDDDADWYTGNFTNASGEKKEGIFPRNFVEKYEPAIPSRPTRTPKRATAQESSETSVEAHPALQNASEPAPVVVAREAGAQPLAQDSQPSVEEELVPPPPPEAVASHPAAALPPQSPPLGAKSVAPKAAPPVAEKPSSFRDRIAAFNKPAAAPIAPFKPGGQGGSTSFIKKPFVAPPPSKNSYVPPSRELPPQKIYRREEDPSIQREEDREASEVLPPAADPEEDDQPKPTSLKERIALLQKQQLEQAARHADAGQKKEKPKKPPKKRVESSEDFDTPPPVTEGALERQNTTETVGNKSIDVADEESEVALPPPHRRPSAYAQATPPPPPARELVSDTNDADDSGAGDTEDAQEISTEEDRPRSKGIATIGHVESTPTAHEQATEEENEEAEDEETEEEEEDPEVRRRRELRDRMAKMSGGMGMMGMFGHPGGMPPSSAPRKPKAAIEEERESTDERNQEAMARAPPVPIMALPGMVNTLPKRKEEPTEEESDHDNTALPTPQETSRKPDTTDDYISQPPKRSSTDRFAPLPPQERAAPPPPQREARAAPPPPPGSRPVPAAPQSPTFRSVPPPPHSAMRSSEEPAQDFEEDQYGTLPDRKLSVKGRPLNEFPTLAPPVPPTRSQGEPPVMDTTNIKSSEKHAPRSPPPVPTSPTSPQTRAPPPPPPGQPPSRRSTSDSRGIEAPRHQVDEESEDEVTEYDGDYDTDIASSAKHKDALKSHNRDSSIDDGILTDDATKSPASPPTRAVPPLPPTSAPRDVPPPPPQQSPIRSRKSTEAPRVAPPPVPPPVPPPKIADEEGEYDPYRYSAPQHGVSSPTMQQTYSPMQSPREEMEDDDMYGLTPDIPFMPPRPPIDRAAPAPPPAGLSAAPPMDPSRPSADVKRSVTTSRRSMDQARPSGEHGFIATGMDLGQSSMWWMQDNRPPPALQNRADVLYEMETSSANKRGGKSSVSKDVYVLYMDYSQSTINAIFDPSEPSYATLEQSHQRPPPPPRKDQLESASEVFGAQIAKAASNYAASGAAVADGSAQALVIDLIRTLSGALLPVGTRAYGALVYANLANASTQQYDEIRPGDIVSFRNAKFGGHKGGLHAKYSMDVGKPEHVGVVIDWDGTKKKIRAWEQGREEKSKKTKVREESFKVGDLKSGEVRVWRVMPRSWVGWDKS